MIRNCTYLLPNIIQTYTMNIELTPMTEFQFRVDPHSNIRRHMKPKNILEVLNPIDSPRHAEK